MGKGRGEKTSWLSYQSVQMIEIKNPTLGLIYYITLFVVAVYVIGYTVFYNKGYQFQEALVANTMVKMKVLQNQTSILTILMIPFLKLL